MCETCPTLAHHIGQPLVGGSGLGQLVLCVAQGVETELQFMTVYATVVHRRTPREHIHISLRRAMDGDVVCGDDGLRTEQPVDAQQVVWRMVGIGLAKSSDIGIGVIAEGLRQGVACLILGHRLLVGQPLQLIERGADEDGDVIGQQGEAGLERLLEQRLSIGRGTEAPHHRRAGLSCADARCHGTLTGGVERVVGHVVDALDVLIVDAQLTQDGLTQFLAHRLRVHVEDGAAHDDGFVEQTTGGGHAEQGAHLTAAARLTEDGDIRWVAAKLADIVTHPPQRGYHIEHSHVPRLPVTG